MAVQHMPAVEVDVELAQAVVAAAVYVNQAAVDYYSIRRPVGYYLIQGPVVQD